IDAAIDLIKKSPGANEAKIALCSRFKIDDIQAGAILDMKLQRLTSLEQGKIRIEHQELLVTISHLESILADERKIYALIKGELLDLIERFGDARKTQIAEGGTTDVEDEDLIKEEEMVVTISNKGYLKRLPIDTYRQQKRGGRGVKGAETADDDFISDLFISSTHAYLLFFSNKGRITWLKVHQAPLASRTARGTAVVNLITLAPDERVSACIPVRHFEDSKFLVLATANGTIKKTPLSEYSRPRTGGIIAINLLDGDELIGVGITDGKKDIILGTRDGIAIRFSEEDVRPVGRAAQGVRGIKLRTGDRVVDMVIPESNTTIFTLTEKGYGKRTPVDDYRTIGRGGMGVINLKVADKNGHVVALKSVTLSDELMLISKRGIVIRTPINTISEIGRSTQGVRVMRLDEGDEAVACAIVLSDESPPPVQ
ncbi:MAG TPA: DNA gyrase C-terminal beta-propeller domain-containing protein, partial [Candidatus Nanoarchaeia archaeon]|nr:DNA gyrase C-terminal beta-propeller domain-containing protein [Candidatus Nanoarchaeia archaeon]